MPWVMINGKYQWTNGEAEPEPALDIKKYITGSNQPHGGHPCKECGKPVYTIFFSRKKWYCSKSCKKRAGTKRFKEKYGVANHKTLRRRLTNTHISATS